MSRKIWTDNSEGCFSLFFLFFFPSMIELIVGERRKTELLLGKRRAKSKVFTAFSWVSPLKKDADDG